VRNLFVILFLLFISFNIKADGYDVFGLGYYDVKFDGSDENPAVDYRYERRFDNSLLDIGPEEDNFFYLKPFLGAEFTSDSAVYLLGGFYLEDNLGDLFIGKENKYIFTPSFGFGYYDKGHGKNLGNSVEFRTTLEVSYELESKNRIGISISHISNAEIGKKNPGVEVVTLSYQIPF